jgi:hypothetical protein
MQFEARARCAGSRQSAHQNGSHPRRMETRP